MAKLTYFYGAMGSAKTLRLLTIAYNFEEKGIPFIAIKPSLDTRDGSGIIKSRVGLERECVSIDSNIDIYHFIKDYNNVISSTLSKLELVLVDECQFLTEKQVDGLAMVADRLNINVMCFGLRTDFTSHSFQASKRLFELADEIEEIKSRCSCGNKASINARYNENNELVLSGSQVMIGGNDLYKPMCRRCWFEEIRKHKEKINS